MHKLEMYVVEFLQNCLMLESLDEKKSINKYIELESELILLSKGTEEKEIYLTSECNLHNMESSLIKCVKIIDNHYKIVWSDIFLFLTGEKNEKDVPQSLLTNELRMLRISNKPLSNYLKTK